METNSLNAKEYKLSNVILDEVILKNDAMFLNKFNEDLVLSQIKNYLKSQGEEVSEEKLKSLLVEILYEKKIVNIDGDWNYPKFKFKDFFKFKFKKMQILKSHRILTEFESEIIKKTSHKYAITKAEYLGSTMFFSFFVFVFTLILSAFIFAPFTGLLFTLLKFFISSSSAFIASTVFMPKIFELKCRFKQYDEKKENNHLNRILNYSALNYFSIKEDSWRTSTLLLTLFKNKKNIGEGVVDWNDEWIQFVKKHIVSRSQEHLEIWNKWECSGKVVTKFELGCLLFSCESYLN